MKLVKKALIAVIAAAVLLINLYFPAAFVINHRVTNDRPFKYLGHYYEEFKDSEFDIVPFGIFNGNSLREPYGAIKHLMVDKVKRHRFLGLSFYEAESRTFVLSYDLLGETVFVRTDFNESDHTPAESADWIIVYREDRNELVKVISDRESIKTIFSYIEERDSNYSCDTEGLINAFAPCYALGGFYSLHLGAYTDQDGLYYRSDISGKHYYPDEISELLLPQSGPQGIITETD